MKDLEEVNIKRDELKELVNEKEKEMDEAEKEKDRELKVLMKKESSRKTPEEVLEEVFEDVVEGELEGEGYKKRKPGHHNEGNNQKRHPGNKEEKEEEENREPEVRKRPQRQETGESYFTVILCSYLIHANMLFAYLQAPMQSPSLCSSTEVSLSAWVSRLSLRSLHSSWQHSLESLDWES